MFAFGWAKEPAIVQPAILLPEMCQHFYSRSSLRQTFIIYKAMREEKNQPLLFGW